MAVHRGRASLLTALVAVLVAASVAPATAARYEPVGVEVASFKTDYTKFEALDDARLGIIIELVGAGVIDCLDNAACAAEELDGQTIEIRQSLTATLDTATGRVRGRIVIDVISAGFTADGQVSGALTPRTEPAQWDLVLTARAQADGGAQASFELRGLLDRASASEPITGLLGEGTILASDAGWGRI